MALFKKIFVEKDAYRWSQTDRVLKAFTGVPVFNISSIDEIFGKVRKPYLQKRTDLFLFLGVKRGILVKEAPPAYGFDTNPHYYFIHAYNCIYECEYCFLQGYFNSPDIVMFVNHDEICREIESIAEGHENSKVWFHAGEFSDSLALAAISDEWPVYWETFENLPNAFLELRTKAINIRPITKLKPLENIIISFSLSPRQAAQQFDLKTPGLAARLKVIRELSQKGYKVGIHCDPVIYNDSFESDYANLFSDLKKYLDLNHLEYISLGVVRFTRNVFREVAKNYPHSRLLSADFVKSFDNKVRYNRPFRNFILNRVREAAMRHGFPGDKIYFCMED